MNGDVENGFNRDRAELFEALGHPTRIRIVEALSESPLGFAALKRKMGIDSNGLLAFHLGKLEGLVKTCAKGDYMLTDEGREAMRIMVLKNSIATHADKNRFFITPLQIAALIIVIGMVVAAVIAAFSYTQLSGQDVIFNQNSIPIDGHTYVAYQVNIDLNGKSAPKVVGEVGSVGNGVDFYLVNGSSWISWSENPQSRSTFSMVHLNATAVASQSWIENQFSFTPIATEGNNAFSYSAVFVSNDFPNASNVIVYGTINLQYMNLSSLYSLAADLAVIAIGSLLLTVMAYRKTRHQGNRSC
jgi:DNA-binding transcriptional ArsR family regulator